MLTVRRGAAAESNAAGRLGSALMARLEAHPFLADAHGTVVVGLGAPAAITAADALPRVVAPLAWPAQLGPLGRAQLMHANAIVAVDRCEHRQLASAITFPLPPVVTSDASGAAHGYLPGATVYDAIEAVTVISEHPDLSRSLPRIHSMDVMERIVDATAIAVVEALVLTGGIDG